MRCSLDFCRKTLEGSVGRDCSPLMESRTLIHCVPNLNSIESLQKDNAEVSFPVSVPLAFMKE
jgi:hypothetical protein